MAVIQLAQNGGASARSYGRPLNNIMRHLTAPTKNNNKPMLFCELERKRSLLASEAINQSVTLLTA